ncbi:MAG: replication factor C large subunit, partial [Desulfurococcales archaeon]|nr:replication factor C large subunit [Desulfurococcales archaeon]
VVRKIFISKYAWQAKLAASQTDLSPDELIQWINENLPKQVSNPEDLWRAYDALSRADVYIGRIVRTGSWDLLAYAMELMTAGVSLAVRTDVKSKYRWVKYSFPQKILIMARTKEVRQIREDLAAVIARHLRISKRLAKSDVIPYLVTIFESNPEYAASLAVGLNLSDSMIKYLSPRNSSRIIELSKKIREQIAREAREEIRKESPEAEAVKTEAETPKTKKARRKKKKEGPGLEAFFKK